MSLEKKAPELPQQSIHPMLGRTRNLQILTQIAE